MSQRVNWWRLARECASHPGAELSHALACGAFGSDFGLMLAWSQLARDWRADKRRILMVCDDPWVFRHVMTLPNIKLASAPPSLTLIERKAQLRGIVARTVLALRLWRWAGQCRGKMMDNIDQGDPVLLVYGHPASRADGFDAYFGTLMNQVPALKRLLHCDCPPRRARELAGDNRSASLHGWGTRWFLPALPFQAWRPRIGKSHPDYWLLRRAAIKENSGGGPAMNRWQMHCQKRFIEEMRPSCIFWPWENHAWERNLCRQAAKMGVRTIGYQHTVIGPHQVNYSVRSNADGIASVPSVVLANGPAYAQELLDWDLPRERLRIGGSWRLHPIQDVAYNPQAPVFVPLSAIPSLAMLQLEAARHVAATGKTVLVKEHPMYPISFTESHRLQRTQIGMNGHQALSLVLYSSGTSGLEALFAGLPALRLRGVDRISIDVLPKGMETAMVELETLDAALRKAEPLAPLAFEEVLAPVDLPVWRDLLSPRSDRAESD